jgi:hypothetical protein
MARHADAKTVLAAGCDMCAEDADTNPAGDLRHRYIVSVPEEMIGE